MNNLPTFCHITPEYNAPSILEYGISSSPDGYIYLFQDGNLLHTSGKSLPMSDTVALLLNKIQTNHYFKFSIDPKGFETPIEQDTKAITFGGGYHWKVRQGCVKSEFVKVVDYRAAVKNDAIELRNMFIADKLGLPYLAYQELRQIMAKRLKTSGAAFKKQVLYDEWEHVDKPPTVLLENRQILEIIKIRANFYNSKNSTKLRS